VISIIEHGQEKLLLYDNEAHAIVRDSKGNIRFFSHRPSARGTRSRLNRGVQNYLVRGGNRVV